MLAIVIYVIAALAVVAIGLVTVGRETFAASQVARPAMFELDQAVEFVTQGLDDRTASRLTPDDVKWIIETDAAHLVAIDQHQSDPGVDVLDDTDSVARVMERRSEAQRAVIDEADVAAVLAGRFRYLEAIGAIGPRAADVPDAETSIDADDTGVSAGD